MKEGTESNVKFKKLKRRLRLTEWQAIGLLETLWKLTRNSCPAGDIGRFSNEDIAASIEWDGDADELIECLVACGWLDEDEEFRLIVHDWSDHVPTYLKGNFTKHKKEFANDVAKQRAKQRAKEGAKEGANQGATNPSTAEPSQVESIQSLSLSTRSEMETRETELSEGFAQDWVRWRMFRFQSDGKHLTDIHAETVLYRLASSGADKAKRDIAFSIEKNAKTILDSDNDLSKRQSGNHQRKSRLDL